MPDLIVPIHHPEVGHWAPGPDVWVVDEPEYTIPHDEEIVWSQVGADMNVAGWTGVLLAENGSGATGTSLARQGSSPNYALRLTSVGAVNSVNPTLEMKLTRSDIPTVPGRSYVVSADLIRTNTSGNRASILFGTAVSPTAQGTTGGARSTPEFVASAPTTELALQLLDVPGAGSVATIWGEIKNVVVTQLAWTEVVPEEGHYIPGPDVWVVDTPAYTTYGTVSVPTPSVEDVLYGDRITTYRWEVLDHVNGVDQLVGLLDGVSDGALRWTQNAAVKGGGKAQVIDLAVAQSGMLRIGELSLESMRVRPVLIIEGLPEVHLGTFLVSAAVEEWEDTGRVWSLELLDRCTVPSQDAVEEAYAVAAGTLILPEVKAILATCDESITIDASVTLATSSGMVWEAGTSKLKIINDLLDVAGYNALWMDGFGNFRVTPRILPADRSLTYDLLGIPRELRDGEQAIYRPGWTRDRDSFEVPNKVIAVQAAGGEDDAALTGVWTNEDISSPYSYQSRGRWITHVLDSVECPEGTPAEIEAFLEKRAQTTLVQMSAVQAQVKIEHLPIPVRVSDVIRFSHTGAGVDSKHVVTQLELETNAQGMMKSTLQEVISL
jgi:hypothetical protein